MRWLAGLLLLLMVAFAGAWWWAGRGPAPRIEIQQPTSVVGQSTPLQVVAESGRAPLSSLEIAIEQNGKRHGVYSLGKGGGGEVSNEAGRMQVSRRVGKAEWPDLQPGPARIIVNAARPALFGLRHLSSSATRDVQVRLEPPRVEVLSSFHFINQGGAEFVVFRATPPDVDAGVRVGDVVYPAFPGAGVGIADPAVRVAFFALLYNQDPNASMVVFARDPAGSEAVAALDRRVFPKPFSQSRIQITDDFLQKVVPQIAAANTALGLPTGPDELLKSFLRINGDLRKRNNQVLVDLAQRSSKAMLWSEAFEALGNAKVEARFADSRTYIYQGNEVDHQVHLGFDLAVTAHVPVLAANRGVVLLAGDLGIYGNCIVLDHGLGVQSLYGHLSSIGVKAGETVQKGQMMGRSGTTGLAAGDHLHFTMLVNGQPVNPVEWWDPKWMQDRVFRKIAEAGGKLGS
jgi:murein DD-endopeptidase MepM/ murein hydrolase activator NlpD